VSAAPPGPAPLSLGRKAVAALFAGFLIFGRQIASWTHEGNRYFSEWRHEDTLALFADVLVLAALLLAAELIVARLGERLRRAGRPFFVLIFVFGLLAAIPWELLSPGGHAGLIARWAWLVAALAAALAWLRPQLRLPRLAANLCLLFSPVVAVVFLQMLAWHDWGSEQSPRFLTGPASRATPVFLFVFDEWSFQRSTQGGEFRADLPNLRALAAQSMFFRAARSPGHDTEISLPRTLYQTTDEFFTEGVHAGWKHGVGTTPSEVAPSVFARARAHGYRTSMLGFYLPYHRILGNQAEFCRSYRLDPGGRTFAGKMLQAALRNLRYAPDPVSLAVAPHVFAATFSQHWYQLNRNIQDDADSILTDAAPNTLGVFHWPLPHAPFVFNPDGSYAGPFPATDDYAEGYNRGTPGEYQRQLRYLDAVVGHLMRTLRAAHKFDDALLILTSDHSWRREPDSSLARASARARWVPLLVKLPHQTAGAAVDQEFSTVGLMPLLELAFEGRATEAEARRALRLPPSAAP